MGILFLTNFYVPIPLANGVCVHSLALELIKEGVDVYVICFKRKNEKKEEVIEGVNIIRIPMPLYQRLLFFGDDNKRRWYGTPIKRIGVLISRIKKAIHVNEYPLRDMRVVDHYIKKTEELVLEQKINSLISVYTPYEAVKAGSIIKKKHPNIGCLLYSLDTLSNESGKGLLSLRFRSSFGEKQEFRFFDSFDRLILMNCHRSHYCNEKFKKYQGKMFFADFPLFIRNCSNGCSLNEKTIVFTGSLYRTIRNPKKALEILSPELDDYSLHFYGFSDCKEIIDAYSKRHPGHIFDHGLVSHTEALDAMYRASFLLSIGNQNTDMVPSKIYEYAATGKPIIHIYNDENDSCLNVLKEYGNSICILASSEINQENLHDFLITAKECDFAVVKDKFRCSTPEYTTRLLKL